MRVQHLSVPSLCLSLLLISSHSHAQTGPLPERPDMAPAPTLTLDPALSRSPAALVSTGPYTSRQVNVDGAGLNIVGDAANEPSLAVDPTDPDVIVVGWRQFDSIASSFREAGWAYTHDGGDSWTFPGVLEDGVFRSDPVLAADASGVIYYQSLSLGPNDEILNQVFRSTDGGVSWGPSVEAFGGDKNWLAIDTSGGPGHGHVYGIWQPFFDCCDGQTLTRSVDGAQSFQFPVEVAGRPLFGTLTVGGDGTVFMAGVEGTVSQDLGTFVLARSGDAQLAGSAPTSSVTVVDLGGGLTLGDGPNPSGLLGQAVVAVDSSGGPFDGAVYLLASVDPSGGFGPGPTEVHIARSDDGGASFGPSVTVNDDGPANGNWHWLATVGVAPNGRVDAVWYDTRDSGVPNLGRLTYSWSLDGGDSWAPNQPASPLFDSHLGWPVQQKMGDYTTLVSHADYADVAYAATFNGEQDVFHARVFPVGLFEDLGLGLAGSAGTPVLSASGTLLPGTPVQLSVEGGAPLAAAGLFVGLSRVDIPFKGGTLVPAPDVLFTGLVTDGAGELQLVALWPDGLPPALELTAQVWIQDGTGPAGLSASNGLKLLAP